MSSRLEQAVDSRLDEIRDLFRSGLSELTGKARKTGHGSTLEYGARFRGVKAGFRELRYFKESPQRIAQAIERGSGSLYSHLRGAVREELAPYVKRERRAERPTVGPHESLSRRCRKCGIAHGKGAHRFHGRGSWLQTHLFPFKANMKNPGRGQKFVFHGSYTSLILARRKERSLPGGFILKRGNRYYVMSSYPRKNPARLTPENLDTLTRRLMDMIPGNARGVVLSYDRAKVLVKHSSGDLEKALRLYKERYRKNPASRITKIYGRVLRIEAQKTGKHHCDAECKRFGHRYYHEFKVSPRMYGLPDGSLLIK